MWCMQCRLPATIRCLSHPSAHVRALSTSVLRDILHARSTKTNSKPVEINGTNGPSYQYFNLDVIDWQVDIEKCLTWEAHSRLATGMSIQFLDTAAKELGCIISIWHQCSFLHRRCIIFLNETSTQIKVPFLFVLKDSYFQESKYFIVFLNLMPRNVNTIALQSFTQGYGYVSKKDNRAWMRLLCCDVKLLSFLTMLVLYLIGTALIVVID